METSVHQSFESFYRKTICFESVIQRGVDPTHPISAQILCLVNDLRSDLHLNIRHAVLDHVHWSIDPFRQTLCAI